MPSDISHLALAGGRTEELETLRQLQTELPAAYTVFHGIHWSREYRTGIKFGELDFVLVNQAGKVLHPGVSATEAEIEAAGQALREHLRSSIA